MDLANWDRTHPMVKQSSCVQLICFHYEKTARQTTADGSANRGQQGQSLAGNQQRAIAEDDDQFATTRLIFGNWGSLMLKNYEILFYKHAFLNPSVESAKTDSMSAILSADDLNDFISPGVACIKPVETLPKQAPEEINVYLQIFFFSSS